MKSSRQPFSSAMLSQMLTEDYWTGYYTIDPLTVVRCQDRGGNTAVFTVHSLKDGRIVCDGSVPYAEGAQFSVIDAAIRSVFGRGVSLRISDEVSSPDRDDEITSVLESGDPFQMLRVRNLITYISTRGIRFFGGSVGGKLLYTGGYAGFYRLGDGKILYCYDLGEWEPSEVQFISDGVVAYHVLDPESFRLSSSKRQVLGYLRDDTFSVLMEKLSAEHGSVFNPVGLEGEEMYDLLTKAVNGDVKAADLASHRLKIRIAV